MARLAIVSDSDGSKVKIKIDNRALIEMLNHHCAQSALVIDGSLN